MRLRFLMYSAFVMGGMSVAQAEGHLKATSMQADTEHPTKLVLTISNEGDRPLAFEEYTTPLVLLDDVHTSYMQFDVEDIEPPHERARYRGYYVHNLGHPEENYVTFQPGESRLQDTISPRAAPPLIDEPRFPASAMFVVAIILFCGSA